MSVRQDPRSRKWFFRFRYDECDFAKGGFKSEKVAIGEEAVLKHRLIEGKPPPTQCKVLSIAEGIEVWFATNPPDKSARSLVNERARLELALRFFENRRLHKLHQIQREDIEAFLAAIPELRRKTHTRREYKTISKQTVNHYFSLLRAFWNRLRERRMFLGENPCEGIKKMKVNEARLRYLLPSEEKLLTPCVRKDKDVYPYYVVALMTGCRMGELQGLRVEDVDLLLKRLFVGRGANGIPTKSRRSRYIPLSDELVTYLATLIKGKGFSAPLLPSWSYEYTHRHFKECVARAGLREAFPFHCLRHTFAQRLLTKGVPIYKVSKMLGHSTVVVTENHYGHLSVQDLAEDINTLEGIVGGLQRVAEETTQAVSLT